MSHITPHYTSSVIRHQHARHDMESTPHNECIEHTISHEGVKPNRSFTAHFLYEDGSQKSFDGRTWNSQE